MKSIHLSDVTGSAMKSVPPTAALRAFERAGVHLSFQQAARDLDISASAVSHQIRSLEERFGVTLFERNQRSVRLTPQGEHYLHSVRAALTMLDAAGRDLARHNQTPASTLRVSSLPFFTSTVLIPWLADFELRNPGLTLHIDTTHHFADFQNSDVDVAIRYGRQRSAGLRFEPLVDVYGMPVCTPKLAGRQLKRPSDFAQQVLICVEAQPHSWTRWFESVGLKGLKPKSELWVGSVPAALEAAEHGLGIALAMHPLINSRKGFGDTLVAPFVPAEVRMETLYLVTRPHQKSTKRIASFRRWVTGAVARASSVQSRTPVATR